MFRIWNFVAYQLAWFAVILGAAQDHAWWGIAVALIVTAIHFALRRDVGELRLAALAAFIGLVLDSTLMLTDQVRFASPSSPYFAPLWMLSLWIAFSTTLNHSLHWLMRRPYVAAAAGGLGGPLAYLAGEKLGALSLATAISLPVIALLWAPALALLSLWVLRQRTDPDTRSVPA